MKLHSPCTLNTKILSDGKVIVSAEGTAISYRRPSFNRMLIELTGQEDESLSRLFFDLLERELAYDQRIRHRSDSSARIELFVNAESVTRNGLMLEAWIRFLVERRHPLNRIHILATNKVSQLSVEIMRHLSATGSLIQLYRRLDEFQAAMQDVELPRVPSRHLHSTIMRLSQYLGTVVTNGDLRASLPQQRS